MVLDGLGIRGYFASVVPATPTLPPKPGPGMLLRVLEELGVPAAAAVMIGDSSADSGVARATGVRSILVRHGYSREPVDNLGADAVIDAFHELDGVLASLKRLPL
jgi:phosphoglycolate phosphatase